MKKKPKQPKQPKQPNPDETPTPITTVGASEDADDTQVAPAPDEDEWDGPTREVAADQVAALAMSSAVVSEGEAAAGDGEAAAGDREAAAGDGEAAAGDREAAAGDGEAAASDGEAEGLPEPLADAVPGRLENVLESLLFASDKSLTVTELKRLTGERQGAKITEALEALRARRDDTGIQLVSVAGGWTLRTHPENVAWVSRLIAGRPQRLSRAMLETLAIVAYRQPVTRPEIDEIRGVDCGPVLGTLLDRGFVRMIGKKEEVGRPILYGTTPEFLRTFSLRDLSELPTLREFHELSEAHLGEVAKVDGKDDGDPSSPQGVAGEADTTAAGPPATKPPVVARRELDPEEDDELLSELERASSAAAKAAEVPPERPADEPAGSAD